MKILGTGLSGLVGSRIVELLDASQYKFENVSLETGFDITDKESVTRTIKLSPASIVLHLAAKTDVDGCERDKIRKEESDAWKTNVLGTQHIVDACAKFNKKILYISTDFVFDGTKDAYIEEDIPNPVNWYGRTKYEGERIVQQSKAQWVIVRLAYPYRSYFKRKDFVRVILDRLKRERSISMVSDHVMTPTFIDDIAYALDIIITSNATGIFHAVGSQFLTPYDAALCIAKTYGLDNKLISKTTRSKYFKGRAPRPFCLALRNDKIEKLGVGMKSFEQGLKEVKKQRETNA